MIFFKWLRLMSVCSIGFLSLHCDQLSKLEKTAQQAADDTTTSDTTSDTTSSETAARAYCRQFIYVENDILDQCELECFNDSDLDSCVASFLCDLDAEHTQEVCSDTCSNVEYKSACVMNQMTCAEAGDAQTACLEHCSGDIEDGLCGVVYALCVPEGESEADSDCMAECDSADNKGLCALTRNLCYHVEGHDQECFDTCIAANNPIACGYTYFTCYSIEDEQTQTACLNACLTSDDENCAYAYIEDQESNPEDAYEQVATACSLGQMSGYDFDAGACIDTCLNESDIHGCVATYICSVSDALQTQCTDLCSNYTGFDQYACLLPILTCAYLPSNAEQCLNTCAYNGSNISCSNVFVGCSGETLNAFSQECFDACSSLENEDLYACLQSFEQGGAGNEEQSAEWLCDAVYLLDANLVPACQQSCDDSEDVHGCIYNFTCGYTDDLQNMCSATCENLESSQEKFGCLEARLMCDSSRNPEECLGLCDPAQEADATCARVYVQCFDYGEQTLNESCFNSCVETLDPYGCSNAYVTCNGNQECFTACQNEMDAASCAYEYMQQQDG